LALLCIPTLSVGQLDIVGDLLGSAVKVGGAVVEGGVKVGGAIVEGAVDAACLATSTAIKTVIAPFTTAVTIGLKTSYKIIQTIHDVICMPIFIARDQILRGKLNSVLSIVRILDPLVAILPKLFGRAFDFIDKIIESVDSIWSLQNKLPSNIIKLPCNRGVVKGNCAKTLNSIQCLAGALINEVPTLVKKIIGLLRAFKNAFVDLAKFVTSFNGKKHSLKLLLGFVATLSKLHDREHEFLEDCRDLVVYMLSRVGQLSKNF